MDLHCGLAQYWYMLVGLSLFIEIKQYAKEYDIIHAYSLFSLCCLCIVISRNMTALNEKQCLEHL